MEAFWKLLQDLKNLITPKKKPPKNGVNYEFYHIENSTLTGIRLLKGKFSGVAYYYGVVKMMEDFGVAKLSFEFKIMECGKHSEESLHKSDEFVTMIGDILTELIITEQAKNEQIGDSDFEEPNIF